MSTVKTLIVTVSEKTTKGVKSWEGSVNIPGLKPTKLSKGEGVTSFATRGALNTVARAVAAKLGFELKYVEPLVKIAAAKAVTKTAKVAKVSKTATKTSTSTPPTV